MKAVELRKKSVEDLGKELIELRKAQFNAKMQLTMQQSNKTDQISKIKKDIARVKHVMAEKVEAN
ncbi:ribosomal protein L29 [beta proteobacterium KB13]|uniref:Large ribosomal subunit protein uL29 n=1 Tax=beta proteobacterium KB13 TaxID=314607 RepID=B6BV70_9PROT|nr:ribosomal protein L29 [beta proteobacterium KB13]